MFRNWSTIALLNKDIYFFLFVSIDLTVIRWASDRNRRKCSRHCVNEMKVAILEEMHFWPPMAKITTGCQQLQWWVVLDLQPWQRTCASHKNSNYTVIILNVVSHVSGTMWGVFFCVMFFPMLGRGRQITGSPLTQTATWKFVWCKWWTCYNILLSYELGVHDQEAQYWSVANMNWRFLKMESLH